MDVGQRRHRLRPARRQRRDAGDRLHRIAERRRLDLDAHRCCPTTAATRSACGPARARSATRTCGALRQPQLQRQPGGAERGADDHVASRRARRSPAASRPCAGRRWLVTRHLPDLFYEVLIVNRTTGRPSCSSAPVTRHVETDVILRSGAVSHAGAGLSGGLRAVLGGDETSASRSVPVPSTAPTITSAVVSGGNSLSASWTAVAGAEWYQVQVDPAAAGGPGRLGADRGGAPGGRRDQRDAAGAGRTGLRDRRRVQRRRLRAVQQRDGHQSDRAEPGGAAGRLAARRIGGERSVGAVHLEPHTRRHGATRCTDVYVQDQSRQRAALDVLHDAELLRGAAKGRGRHVRCRGDRQSRPGRIRSPGRPSTFTVRGVFGAWRRR